MSCASTSFYVQGIKFHSGDLVTADGRVVVCGKAGPGQVNWRDLAAGAELYLANTREGPLTFDPATALGRPGRGAFDPQALADNPGLAQAALRGIGQDASRQSPDQQQYAHAVVVAALGALAGTAGVAEAVAVLRARRDLVGLLDATDAVEALGLDGTADLVASLAGVSLDDDSALSPDELRLAAQAVRLPGVEAIVPLEVEARLGAHLGHSHQRWFRGLGEAGQVVDATDEVLAFCASARGDAAAACYKALLRSHDSDFAASRRRLGHLARGEAELTALAGVEATDAEMLDSVRRGYPDGAALVPEVLDALVRRTQRPTASLFAGIGDQETRLGYPDGIDSPAVAVLGKLFDPNEVARCFAAAGAGYQADQVARRVASLDPDMAEPYRLAAQVKRDLDVLATVGPSAKAAWRQNARDHMRAALRALPKNRPYDSTSDAVVNMVLTNAGLGRDAHLLALAAVAPYTVRSVANPGRRSRRDDAFSCSTPASVIEVDHAGVAPHLTATAAMLDGPLMPALGATLVIGSKYENNLGDGYAAAAVGVLFASGVELNQDREAKERLRLLSTPEVLARAGDRDMYAQSARVAASMVHDASLDPNVKLARTVEWVLSGRFEGYDEAHAALHGFAAAGGVDLDDDLGDDDVDPYELTMRPRRPGREPEPQVGDHVVDSGEYDTGYGGNVVPGLGFFDPGVGDDERGVVGREGNVVSVNFGGDVAPMRADLITGERLPMGDPISRLREGADEVVDDQGRRFRIVADGDDPDGERDEQLGEDELGEFDPY